MTHDHSRSYQKTAPKLAELSRDVLFGDVWERAGLNKRDRSLITVAALVASYRPLQMPFHMKRALENGVTPEELVEVVTHLAFYAGWPSAVTAAEVLGQVLDEQGSSTSS
jgi:4-carboxymuconolactone decarboxylase